MRILCTNDDGVHAQGLAVLERIARTISDDVWVIAPETEQSGASRALTLSAPIRVREAGAKRFAVSGTPTDCVLLGVEELIRDGRPDLVLSGVNRGQNIAEDVTFSGTIAGAMQGMQLGIPAIALSQARDFRDGAQPIPWETAETFGRLVIANAYADWQDDWHQSDPENLYAAGIESGRLAAYRVDQDTGQLEPVDTYPVGKTPMWVLITKTGE